jgi:hypothetical protein
MTVQTLSILDAALKADASVTAAQRSRILKVARAAEGEPGPEQKSDNGNSPPRIYSRTQAAEMLGGKTTRYVSQLVTRGLLKKFLPRGNKRAIGITSESLNAFIAGGLK